MEPPRPTTTPPVSLDVEFTNSRLSLAARSRLVSAIDRLGGDFFSLGSALITRYRHALEEKARTAREIARLQGDAQIDEVRQILALEADLRAARAAENKTAVAEETLRIFNSHGVGDIPDENQASEISRDWLEEFARRSEGAFSDRLRVLLGNALAVQAMNPNSLSLSSLRLLCELPDDLVDRFRTVAQFRIADSQIAVTRDMRGIPLSDILDLQNAGLITGAGGLLTSNFSNLKIEGRYLGVDNFCVDFFQHTPAFSRSTSVIVLTRPGVELAKLIPTTSDYLRIIHLVSCIIGSVVNLPLIELGEHVSEERRIVKSVVQYDFVPKSGRSFETLADFFET
jgi:hypothetical protein